jgi:tRNA (adenine37-N6)-methyltransferase
MDIILTPIGIVKNGVFKPGLNDWKKTVSEIEIDKKYQQALFQLDEFSHIKVLFWMSQVPLKKRTLLKIHPRDRQDLPLVGVFATRSQMRPNPIGITTVKLLKINDNILSVQGLDALNGTPVLDIKPFIPGNDLPSKVIAPKWVKKLTE